MLDYPACAIRRGGVRLRGLKPALRQEAIICPLDVRRFHDLPLPVIPFPVAVENEHLARYDLPEECEWVFPGDAEGKPLQDIKRFWEDVRAKAELPAVRIHDLRHTFASLLVSGGMTLPMIGKLLGHTQVQTTQRYAHKLDDPLRAGLEQVGDMLRAKPKLVQNICS